VAPERTVTTRIVQEDDLVIDGAIVARSIVGIVEHRDTFELG
jgi:hypothetical protein